MIRSATRSEIHHRPHPPVEAASCRLLPWGRGLAPRALAGRVIEIGHQQQTEVDGLCGFARMLLDCKINRGWQGRDLGGCYMKLSQSATAGALPNSPRCPLSSAEQNQLGGRLGPRRSTHGHLKNI